MSEINKEKDYKGYKWSEQMNFDLSDSETELLLLNDRDRSNYNKESEYINPRVNRRSSTSAMVSFKQIMLWVSESHFKKYYTGWEMQIKNRDKLRFFSFISNNY